MRRGHGGQRGQKRNIDAEGSRATAIAKCWSSPGSGERYLRRSQAAADLARLVRKRKGKKLGERQRLGFQEGDSEAKIHQGARRAPRCWVHKTEHAVDLNKLPKWWLQS